MMHNISLDVIWMWSWSPKRGSLARHKLLFWINSSVDLPEWSHPTVGLLRASGYICDQCEMLFPGGCLISDSELNFYRRVNWNVIDIRTWILLLFVIAYKSEKYPLSWRWFVLNRHLDECLHPLLFQVCHWVLNLSPIWLIRFALLKNGIRIRSANTPTPPKS